ncbi:MAG TPA: glycosyltransferase [Acidobacteriaceae bacterium]|nr:glycosyltransferase [Acidobacteriaceae bacterium]
MKLLHVICSLNPAGGGPPEAVRQIAKAYAALGHSMEVACQDQPNSSWLKGLSFPVHAFGGGALGGFGYSPRLAAWLGHNAGRFDALVMHGLWSYAGMAVRSAALRAGLPYGVFPHGGIDPWFNRQYPLKHLKKRIFWPLQYPVLRDAAAVFFTTEKERDLAATSFSPNRWNSVPVSYGISDPEGDPPAQIEAFYSKLPQARGRRYLLFLSRIHEKKGCDLLLEAFARVAPSVPDLDLVIAGPDQVGLQAKLQQLAADAGAVNRVHWPGMLTGDFKWGAYRAADAFILPSHQENFGIVVVESLAAGRPVLISNQVNVWTEIVADGVGLVEDDTLEGTERLLRRWIALSPAEREGMAAQTRATFARRYSMKNAAQAIVSLFAKLRHKPAAAQETVGSR